MHCGSIRYTATKPAGAPHDLELIPRSRISRIDLPTDAGIQDVFGHLTNDLAKSEAIAAEVKNWLPATKADLGLLIIAVMMSRSGQQILRKQPRTLIKIRYCRIPR